MNIFESGKQKVIPAVLIYVVDAKSQVLMIHRVSKNKDDFHLGKWNGLGGKLEPGESPVMAAQRELREESGLELRIEDFKLTGVLQFPLFKAHKNEDWLVWAFVAKVLDTHLPYQFGEDHPVPFFESKEGELHWVPITKVMSLNLWPGDREFLPQILKGEFYAGTIWYHEGQVVRTQVYGDRSK